VQLAVRDDLNAQEGHTMLSEYSIPRRSFLSAENSGKWRQNVKNGSKPLMKTADSFIFRNVWLWWWGQLGGDGRVCVFAARYARFFIAISSLPSIPLPPRRPHVPPHNIRRHRLHAFHGPAMAIPQGKLS